MSSEYTFAEIIHMDKGCDLTDQNLGIPGNETLRKQYVWAIVR